MMVQRSAGRALVGIFASGLLLACGSVRDDEGRGGSAGVGVAGGAVAGAHSGGTEAGAGRAGSSETAGISGSGGAPTTEAGSGGSAIMAAGGGSLAGASGNHDAWTFPSGDPLNSTPPVLAAAGDGIVIAGATSDPTLVGVAAFEPGIVGEAFVARLDHRGQRLWSVRLADAGMPSAIVALPSGEFLVLAPFLPDAPFVSPGSYGDSGYLAKIDPSGTLIYERELPFLKGTRLNGMAADATGKIYVAGAQSAAFPNESVLLQQLDADAHPIWTKLVEHSGSTAYAACVTITSNGDPVIAGTFNGSLNFGGETLVTQALSGGFMMPNGFVARFTPSGGHVFSRRFGGTVFDLGNALAALDGGDLLLGGKVSGLASVGGKTVTADTADGSAFVARLDGQGNARWLALAATKGSTQAIVPDAAGGGLHAAGQFDNSAYLAQFDADGNAGPRTSAVVGDIRTSSAAIDAAGSIWAAGSYMGNVDFGNANQLQGSDTGVFLVRVDRLP